MTSTHALELTRKIINNDMAVAEPLLVLLNAFTEARGDPTGEAMTRDVMLFIYSKTEHCETAMMELISHDQLAA